MKEEVKYFKCERWSPFPAVVVDAVVVDVVATAVAAVAFVVVLS